MTEAKGLFSYRKYWAQRFGTAPFLPMSRAEMEALGWDSCDIVLVTGDAYVDHPSFGMAIIGRLLEAQGFRVGIIAQPDWQTPEPFRALGRPNLFFGVTAGNMDSMVNRYTADRRIRHNDSYTPGDEGGKRPDRSVIVYAQRCREAFGGTPIVIGGIEASLRRIAHYDYWSDKVRRSVLVDAKADLLVFGNAERAIVEIAHRTAKGEHPSRIRDIRGTAVWCDQVPAGWAVLASDTVDAPVAVAPDAMTASARARGLAPAELLASDPAGRASVPAMAPEAAQTEAASAGCAGKAGTAARTTEMVLAPRIGRAHRRAAAELRAGEFRPRALRPCLARAPSGKQSRQRPAADPAPRPQGDLVQPAADPADHARDGRDLRPALRPQAPSGLWRRQDRRLGHDPVFDQHHARLLRRLFVLLDHRA